MTDWNEESRNTIHRFSLSHNDLVEWFKNNKATLTGRAYGPGEAELFAKSTFRILEDVTRKPQIVNAYVDETEGGTGDDT